VTDPAVLAVLADVIDLAAARAARRAPEQRRAGQPVRFITPEFVEALRGSWGEIRPNTGSARAVRAL
jgi:hypothetical protein